jgi:hypothetical protein
MIFSARYLAWIEEEAYRARMKPSKPTTTQLRYENLNRRMEDLDSASLDQLTGHQSLHFEPVYRMLLVGNRPVESHLVYDKPDLKKLRRLLKSRTSEPRQPRRAPRNRPS